MKPSVTFTAILIAAVQAQISLAVDYYVTDLGALHEGAGESSYARDVNEAGQIVGYSADNYGGHSAYLWDNIHGIQDLGNLGLVNSWANAINASGQIVGLSTAPDGMSYPFIWDSASGMQAAGGIGAATRSTTGALGINDSGQVVGSVLGSDSWEHAFLWDSGNGLQDIHPVQFSSSVAFGINSSGQVAIHAAGGGFNHALLWDISNGFQDLGFLGGDHSVPLGLNDHGQVVGYAQLSTGAWNAFIWDAVHGMQKQGDFGGSFSRAFAINNLGIAVGDSRTAGGEAVHAVMYRGGAIIDINDFSVSVPGWTFDIALGINDAGQIVGGGRYNGEGRSFLLTPVPEPATWTLILLGLMIVPAIIRGNRRADRRYPTERPSSLCRASITSLLSQQLKGRRR